MTRRFLYTLAIIAEGHAAAEEVLISTANPLSHPAPALPASDRNIWVDASKGLLILLVVFGHLIGGLMASGILPDQRLWSWVYLWIYAFHMPAFVLLAGLFLERSRRVGFRAYAQEKARSLYYPRVLWGLIYWGLLFVAQRYTNSKPDGVVPWRLLYDPLGEFWFLMTLFYLAVLYGALRTAGLPRVVVCVLGIVGGVAAQFLGPSWRPTAAHLAWYNGWLMAGVLLAAPLLASPGVLTRTPAWALALLAGAGFAALTLQVPWDYPGIPPYRIEWALPGTIAVVALAVVIGRLTITPSEPLRAIPRGLALLGRRSLHIYLMAGIGSIGCRVVLAKFLHVQAPWVHLVAGMVAGVALPLFAAWFCERIGFEHAFRFGPRPRDPARPTTPTTT